MYICIFTLCNDKQDDQEMEQDEAKDTFLNTAEVMGEKDTLLLNSSKVLRHGKVVSSGEEMTDLTDKIKSVCFLLLLVLLVFLNSHGR